MPPPALDEAELLHYNTFGFVWARQLFSPSEVATLQAEGAAAEAARGEGGGGQVVEESDVLTQLLIQDTRVTGPCRQLLGADMVWSGGELHGSGLGPPVVPAARKRLGLPVEYNEHSWHADRPGPRELQYHRMKIFVYCCETTRDHGAFRVIPGRCPMHPL